MILDITAVLFCSSHLIGYYGMVHGGPIFWARVLKRRNAFWKTGTCSAGVSARVSLKSNCGTLGLPYTWGPKTDNPQALPFPHTHWGTKPHKTCISAIPPMGDKQYVYMQQEIRISDHIRHRSDF